MPFFKRRGRGPNTGDKRNLLMEMGVIWPKLMALASLKRLAILETNLVVGASPLTTLATCEAYDTPPKDAHRTASPTVYVRMFPRLMEFRASILDSALRGGSALPRGWPPTPP